MTAPTTRRAVLAGLLGAATLPFLSGAAFAAPAPGLFLGARKGPDGRFLGTAFNRAGHLLFDVALPSRGHSLTTFAPRREAVFFARRPGSFFVVVDVDTGRPVRTLHPAPGRHVNGHGAFTADGKMLYVTETVIESGDGILGVYDAERGYARLGEVATHGLDPHEVCLMPDGRSLVVANGGILTHPDAPGMKLNVATMEPSLVYLDAADGRLRQQIGLGARLHQLSIRHLAVGRDATVGIAMQYEGPSGDLVPLIGLHRPAMPKIELIDLPRDELRQLRNYCGSAAVDASGGILAVSSPVGGRTVFLDLSEKRLLGDIALADGCGVAAAGGEGAFLLTSGRGTVLRGAAGVGRIRPFGDPALAAGHWDNHLRTI